MYNTHFFPNKSKGSNPTSGRQIQMITDKNHTQTESYTSCNMLDWDSKGYVNGKESEIIAYLASKSLTREQLLLLSRIKPPASLL